MDYVEGEELGCDSGWASQEFEETNLGIFDARSG